MNLHKLSSHTEKRNRLNALRPSYLSAILILLILFVQQETAKSQSGIQVFTKRERGIEFVAKDSIFYTQFQFRIQNRLGYESVSLEDFSPETFEFRARRVRLRLKGFIYDPKWTYHLQLSFSRADMDWEGPAFSKVNTSANVLRDAVINYQVTPSFAISVGQTKLPGNRQRTISSGNQQFIDRSIVNGTFTLDRDCGLFLSYEKNYFKLKGAITTGEGRNVAKTDKGLSYTGRIEILPFGKFTGINDDVEGDLAREEKPKLSIAASYNYNHLALRSGGQLGGDLYEAVSMQNLHIDIMFKYRGFAFYNEFCERLADKPVTVDETGTNFAPVYVGYGNLTQVSYLFKSNWEIALRYAFISPFSSVYANSSFPTVNLNREENIHAGVTKYIVGHRLKVQANVTLNTKYNIQMATSHSRLGAYLQIELGI